MKHILRLFVVFLFLGCGSQKKIAEDKSVVAQVEKVSTKVPAKAVNNKSTSIEERLEAGITYLASDELNGRKTGGLGIEKAAVFIENSFKTNHIKPYFKTYRDSFNVKKITGYNVVGYIEGHGPKLKNEFVILGAHYDHIGTAKKVNGDAIANGANDDASGVMAVLEWAKHFSKLKSNKRSILFTLYAAEEMGLKGSEHLAKRLKAANLNLYAMINFEMVGVPRASSESLAYITGYNKSNLPQKINEYAGSEIVGFLPQAKQYGLFSRSDNFPFYNEFKKPAHAISTFDFTNFDYYHHVDDEADKMDFKHMANFINKMIPALEGMVNAQVQEIKMKNE